MGLQHDLLTKLKKVISTRRLLVATGVASLGSIGTLLVYASVDPWHIEAPAFQWNHKGFFKTLDYASVRRGFQVYREVCSACHSMGFISYRHLINTCLTKEEAIALANSVEYEDGPDDNGNMFMRPGRIVDRLKNPYRNSNAAKAANNGNEPPDLSLMKMGRHRGEDYIMSLLTSFSEPPAGFDAGSNYFNIYMEGGVFGMAPPLYDGQIEYEDGTPATVSQMAKDISTFLAFSSEPFHDDMKRMGIMGIAITIPCIIATYLLSKRANLTSLSRVIEQKKLDWKK